VEGSGTGTIASSGDGETLELSGGDIWTLLSKNTGVRNMEILIDEYDSGSGTPGLIEYRTGEDQAACESAGWETFSSSLSALGWVQVRVSNPGNLGLSVGGALVLSDGVDHLKL